MHTVRLCQEGQPPHEAQVGCATDAQTLTYPCRLMGGIIIGRYEFARVDPDGIRVYEFQGEDQA